MHDCRMRDFPQGRNAGMARARLSQHAPCDAANIGNVVCPRFRPHAPVVKPHCGGCNAGDSLGVFLKLFRWSKHSSSP